jgi:hypothetical protein
MIYESRTSLPVLVHLKTNRLDKVKAKTEWILPLSLYILHAFSSSLQNAQLNLLLRSCIRVESRNRTFFVVIVSILFFHSLKTVSVHIIQQATVRKQGMCRTRQLSIHLYSASSITSNQLFCVFIAN